MLPKLILAALGLVFSAFGQTVQHACATTVTYRFFSGVTAQQQDLIRRGTQASIEFVCRKTGYGSPPFQVAASPNMEDLILVGENLGWPRRALGVSCASSPLGAILINTAGEGCVNWRAPDAAIRTQGILAHEYFHQVQRRLANSRTVYETVNDRGLSWLMEGGAQFVSMLFLDDAGLIAFPDVWYSQFYRSLWTPFPLAGQESSWSPPDSAADSYSFAAAAARLLTDGTQARLALLMTYWESIGKGALARDAFKATFGRSQEAFYEEFDQYVRSSVNLSPTLSYQGAYPAPSNCCVTHLFHGVGFDLPGLFNPSVLLSSLLQLPAGNAGFGGDEKGLVVYMDAGAPSAMYPVGLRLPDGRLASTTFPHTRSSGMAALVPEITGLVPSSVAQGTAGIKLLVNGRNFTPQTAISANGSSVPVLVRGTTQIEVTLSGLTLREPFSLRASNPAPGGGMSNAVPVPMTDPVPVRIEPASTNIPATGGTGRLAVIAAAPNLFWAVSGVPSWMFLSGARTGSGSASLVFSVPASRELVSRSATLNIGGRSFAVTQAAGSLGAPQISTGGVGNAAYTPFTVAADSFVTIAGTGLSEKTLSWEDAIGADGSLPTRLGGVQVRLGGRDCYVSYVSPGQINVLIPPDLAIGTGLLEVATSRGTALADVEVARSSPAFFTYMVNGKSYVAAVFDGESTIVADFGAVPGRASRRARPGDNISLYSNALGPTSETHPVGQVLTGAYPLANASAVRATIAGLTAPVSFAGMTLTGAFQVNVRVPPGVPEGEHPVILQVDGKTTQRDAVLIFAP